MLRDARVAGLVKLHCSVDPCRQWPVWAEHVAAPAKGFGSLQSARMSLKGSLRSCGIAAWVLPSRAPSVDLVGPLLPFTRRHLNDRFGRGQPFVMGLTFSPDLDRSCPGCCGNSLAARASHVNSGLITPLSA